MKKYVYISYSDMFRAFIIYILNEKHSSNGIESFIRTQAKEINEKETGEHMTDQGFDYLQKRFKKNK
jgi:hypothetical protein